MIDKRSIRFDGTWNNQEGLLFSFSRNGHAVNFLIETIGDKKRKIRVTMHPDVNHARPHVHVNGHGASFAIDTGELLIGQCDRKTREIVQAWIRRYKDDLLELWRIAKEGRRYEPAVDKIRLNKSFGDFGFTGDEPQKKEILNGAIIWHNGSFSTEYDAEGRLNVICEGDIFVGLTDSFRESSMMFKSLNGDVQMKRPRL